LMALLARDQLHGASDFEARDVECPEWGGAVLVRPWTAVQRSLIESTMLEANQTKRFDKVGKVAIQCVAWCVVDEQGERVFTEADVKALGEKSSAPILRLRDAIFELSGMSRSEEHTSELQSRENLVCRLLLEKKKKKNK